MVVALAIASTSLATVRDVSTLYITESDWLFVPTTADLEVDSFVALRTNNPTGDNITAVWYRKVNQTWESYAWDTQDQSRAIASVKSILNLPDSTDGKWPIAPHSEPADDPEKFEGGVMESDPFAPVIAGMEDPEPFVQTLEDSGWRAAWLRMWNHPCQPQIVLETWVLAVQMAEAEIAQDGGMNEFIEAFFQGTVSNPCGPDTFVCLVEMTAGAVLQSGDPASVVLDGVVENPGGQPAIVRGAPITEGQTVLHALVNNVGSEAATFLVDDATVVTLQPGSTLLMANTSTYSTCARKCKRAIVGYCAVALVIDSACFCKCWGCSQGDPGWLGNLPNCPCQITVDNNGNPVNPNPDEWENPVVPNCCHPGAAWCMRSCPSVDGDPGQQCCYDSNGQLITEGEGAGTPDIVAPCNWTGLPWWDAWSHYNEDVAPYKHCKAAGMLDCYLKHRPPNNGNGCTCNPPDHPNCGEVVIVPENPCNCDP